ncbi:hypothetical protein V2J09_011838 [Rumex salicifolius]
MSFSTTHAHFLPKLNIAISDKMIRRLCKLLIFIGIFLALFYTIFSEHPLAYCPSSSLEILASLRSKSNWFFPAQSTPNDTNPTNITHLVFGIAGSVNVWKNRKAYIESWWRPNVTKGLLFLEQEPTRFLPWPSTSPPYTFFGDTSKFRAYDKHGMRHAIRMVRVIQETFEKLHGDGVRWFVMADDDTVLFLDNLVSVLARYDHTKYFYIGQNSESTWSNFGNSFEMAFGGAGYALSYPLAQALAKNLDVCIKRYPRVYGSDHILKACVADLGVSLTHEKGIHQIDLHGDLSGFLSAHPQSPFISLHHIETVEPIFPSMTRDQAINHLMEAAEVDQSRLLQQTICYQRDENWSFSTAWGYSVHLYETVIPPAALMNPLETFKPWNKPQQPRYMFNTRFLPSNPCEAPHVFFFESATKRVGEDEIVTRYKSSSPYRSSGCSSSGGNLSSAGNITEILVLSPATKFGGVGSRRECCDIVESAEKNITKIRIRSCLRDEIMGLE